MKILIVSESDAQQQQSPNHTTERRCAATPATVKKLVMAKADVSVETNAGLLAGFTDEEYQKAGATVIANRAEPLRQADIVLYVGKPTLDDVQHLRENTLVIGHLDPYFEQPLIEQLSAKKITAISVEMLPRTTRSQKMDALSSQTNLSGYVMVLNGAQALGTILPMMMTPAGTVKPAKVFIIGAGVAGLQAIATAKRLGASVTAFDTRPVVAEQVQSLGAKFLDIDLGETGQTQQGYANALTPEQMQKQKEGQHQAIIDSDIVITTAQLFGRKPPLIVSAESVAAMKPGSVIVDMAAEGGGNVEGTVPGETVKVGDVTIIGSGNWPNQVPKDATSLYANNLFNLLDEYWNKEEGQFVLDLTDDILDGCVISHQGDIRNAHLKSHYEKSKGA